VSGTSAAFLLATSLAFGIGIAVLVYSIAPVSGGHINPAVTTSLLLIGEIDALTAAAYIVTQFIAAVLGAAIVWGCMTNNVLSDAQDGAPPFLLGSNNVHPDMNLGSAFLIEFMGTFLLVWTVCMTAVSKNSIAGNAAPIAIGWSVFLAHLVLIPYTGCGINPARTFGPHLVVILAGEHIGYAGWWVYYTAPFVGGAAASLLFKFVFSATQEDEAAEEPQKEGMETAKA
jgi:MIP family channel proteins